MAKWNARDYALVVTSAAIGAALALIARLPKMPDENNLLGLAGSLIGAAIAVIAGLVVLGRQFETVDERNLATVKELLAILKVRGLAMKTNDAPLNPTPLIDGALTALYTVRSVTREMQANGPQIALVAQLLHDAKVLSRLQHLATPGLGIAPPDLFGTADDVKDLADEALRRLAGGL